MGRENFIGEFGIETCHRLRAESVAERGFRMFRDIGFKDLPRAIRIPNAFAARAQAQYAAQSFDLGQSGQQFQDEFLPIRFEQPVLTAHLGLTQYPLERRAEAFQISFHHVVVRPRRHGLDRDFLPEGAGHIDERQVERAVLNDP